VSRWFFINRWRGEGLPLAVAQRERVIDELVRAGRVFRYEVTDGKGRNTKDVRLRTETLGEPSKSRAGSASSPSCRCSATPQDRAKATRSVTICAA